MVAYRTPNPCGVGSIPTWSANLSQAMFSKFLYISLCLFIVLISLGTDYERQAIAFVVGMIIGAICKLIADYTFPYFMKLKNKNL